MSTNITTLVRMLLRRFWRLLSENMMEDEDLPAVPFNEAQRQQVVDEYGLGSPDEVPQYNEIVQQAAFVCETSMALMSICDGTRQFFKARVGIESIEVPRKWALCSQAILEPYEVFEIQDTTLDLRFASNPLVTDEPYIRFYAGVPLVNSEGYPLGTLCVLDQQPKKLTADQKLQLKLLTQELIVAIEVAQQSSPPPP